MCERLPDWFSRLQQAVCSFDGKPFIWGTSDCATFAGACVEAITGRNVLGAFYGSYCSRLTAFGRLRGRGFGSVTEAAQQALQGIGAVEIHPRFAMVGDIGATGDDVLAVRMPRGFIARKACGGLVDVTAERAWAVAWPN